MRPSLLVPGMLLVVATLSACDDKPKANPFAPPKDAPKPAPSLTEATKPKPPLEFSVDTLSPKIGFSRVLLNKPGDREKLTKEVDAVRSEVIGKDVTVTADAKANLSWVTALLVELSKVGVANITVKTSTRTEYPQQLVFKLPAQLGNPPAKCSVAAMVLADRGTAVWRLSGGTASKRSKGFAGPDLTMTAENLERYAKGCAESELVFVGGAEGLEWGLVYDLAASTTQIAKGKFAHVVLLTDSPTAGRPVRLN